MAELAAQRSTHVTYYCYVIFMAALMTSAICSEVPTATEAPEQKPTDPSQTKSSFDFSEVDMDGNGCVEGAEEMQHFRLYVGRTLGEALHLGNVERALRAGRIAHSADINGDGRICECDLLSILVAESGLAGKQHHTFRVYEDGSMFDNLDVNHDAFLGDVTEKDAMTQLLAKCVTEDKAQAIVDAIAKLIDDDGKMSREEYLLFLRAPQLLVKQTPRFPAPTLRGFTPHPLGQQNNGQQAVVPPAPTNLVDNAVQNEEPVEIAHSIIRPPRPVGAAGNQNVLNAAQPWRALENAGNPLPPQFNAVQQQQQQQPQAPGNVQQQQQQQVNVNSPVRPMLHHGDPLSQLLLRAWDGPRPQDNNLASQLALHAWDGPKAAQQVVPNNLGIDIHAWDGPKANPPASSANTDPAASSGSGSATGSEKTKQQAEEDMESELASAIGQQHSESSELGRP